MRIPYSVVVVVELLPAVLGILGVIAYPWGLLATLAGGIITVILVARTVQGHYGDKKDFREKIAKEALAVLDRIISNSFNPHISYEVWSGNSKGFKTEMLGDADYGRWEKFYDTLEKRNEYFRSSGGHSYSNVEKHSCLCFEAFFEVYNEISWVRDIIPQERIESLLARAERNSPTYAFVKRFRSQR
jgi:hypothetical protein